ncbi:MAG: hypothetical protein LUH43_03340 [Clostridia bacterium]|nr:hypothetical protein [Clostridia bacterium]
MSENRRLTKEEAAELLERLEEMKRVDVRTVDVSTLVDIADVKIDTSLPPLERVLDFIRQIKNPYCYLDGGIVVKVSFAGRRSMEDSLCHYIRTVCG